MLQLPQKCLSFETMFILFSLLISSRVILPPCLFLFNSTSLPSAAPFCSYYQLSFLPLLSGETKKCLGAPVLRGAGAAAEGEDERWRAAGEDEETPEGPRPPAQTHPESRRPPRLFNVTRLVLVLAPSFCRHGLSMLLEQNHTTHSHAWRQANWEWPSAVVMHALTRSSGGFLCSRHDRADSNTLNQCSKAIYTYFISCMLFSDLNRPLTQQTVWRIEAGKAAVFVRTSTVVVFVLLSHWDIRTFSIIFYYLLLWFSCSNRSKHLRWTRSRQITASAFQTVTQKVCDT